MVLPRTEAQFRNLALTKPKSGKSCPPLAERTSPLPRRPSHERSSDPEGSPVRCSLAGTPSEGNWSALPVNRLGFPVPLPSCPRSSEEELKRPPPPMQAHDLLRFRDHQNKFREPQKQLRATTCQLKNSRLETRNRKQETPRERPPKHPPSRGSLPAGTPDPRRAGLPVGNRSCLSAAAGPLSELPPQRHPKNTPFGCLHQADLLLRFRDSTGIFRDHGERFRPAGAVGESG